MYNKLHVIFNLENLRIPGLKILLTRESTFENYKRILEFKITKLTSVGKSKYIFYL